MLRLRSTWTSAFLMVLLTLPSFADTPPPPKEAKAVATVMNIEGAGSARVRKKAGTESLLAAAQDLAAGDRITTGPDVLVQLMLPDGTVVRVGANTEYRIESAEVKEGVMAWVFSLTKGTVRALVEKAPSRKESKFRVNTPAGTMGVRGTELVLGHNVDNKTTTLFTIEGKVELGAKDCQKKKSCIMVTTGESATISEGQAKPVGPVPLNMKELVGVAMNMPADDDQSPGAQAARAAASMMSVIMPFADRKGGNGTRVEALDDKALRDMVLKTSQEMIALQDAAMDRDAETRRDMHEAIADGTYDDRIKLAEKKEDELTGNKKSPADRENERLSGINNAKKIQAAKQLVKDGGDKSIGSSSDKKKDGKGPSGNNESSGDMASRIAAAAAKKAQNSSGASRAMVGSDISGLVKEAQGQMKKTQETIAINAALLEEASRSERESRQSSTSVNTNTSSSTNTSSNSNTNTSSNTAVTTVSNNGSPQGGGGGNGSGTATSRCGTAVKPSSCTGAPKCTKAYLACRISLASYVERCTCDDTVGKYDAEGTADYLGQLAKEVGEYGSGWYYMVTANNPGGVKVYHSGNAGIFNYVTNYVFKKKKKCRVEVVPCSSKATTGSCLGKQFESREICVE